MTNHFIPTSGFTTYTFGPMSILGLRFYVLACSNVVGRTKTGLVSVVRVRKGAWKGTVSNTSVSNIVSLVHGHI